MGLLARIKKKLAPVPTALTMRHLRARAVVESRSRSVGTRRAGRSTRDIQEPRRQRAWARSAAWGWRLRSQYQRGQHWNHFLDFFISPTPLDNYLMLTRLVDPTVYWPLKWNLNNNKGRLNRPLFYCLLLAYCLYVTLATLVVKGWRLSCYRHWRSG